MFFHFTCYIFILDHGRLYFHHAPFLALQMQYYTHNNRALIAVQLQRIAITACAIGPVGNSNNSTSTFVHGTRNCAPSNGRVRGRRPEQTYQRPRPLMSIRFPCRRTFPSDDRTQGRPIRNAGGAPPWAIPTKESSDARGSLEAVVPAWRGASGASRAPRERAAPRA